MASSAGYHRGHGLKVGLRKHGIGVSRVFAKRPAYFTQAIREGILAHNNVGYGIDAGFHWSNLATPRGLELLRHEKKGGGVMATYDYDILVVGAGQGGLPAAHMAANLGAKVALIEREEVGGT